MRFATPTPIFITIRPICEFHPCISEKCTTIAYDGQRIAPRFLGQLGKELRVLRDSFVRTRLLEIGAAESIHTVESEIFSSNILKAIVTILDSRMVLRLRGSLSLMDFDDFRPKMGWWGRGHASRHSSLIDFSNGIGR